jgi:hypothetical protein
MTNRSDDGLGGHHLRDGRGRGLLLLLVEDQLQPALGTPSTARNVGGISHLGEIGRKKRMKLRKKEREKRRKGEGDGRGFISFFVLQMRVPVSESSD